MARGRHLDDVIDFCLEYAPLETAAWIKDVRASMSYRERTASHLEWQPYRSRETVWVKERTGPNGEPQFRSKDGRIFDAEGFRQRWEKQPKASQTTSNGEEA